ncbi:MAG: SAM-dependent methyltransferase [Clostridia bacterium]|nr:SAM-dependent methyltransferase [Clostridia bacterium]
MLNGAKERLKTEFTEALNLRTLKKAVLSRPKIKSEGKLVLIPFEKNGRISVKSERFLSDGKAIQRVLSADEAAELVFGAPECYRQINIIAGERALELIVSEKGKIRFSGSLDGAKKVELASSQDKKKSYAITPETDGDFLFELGITDKNGRIHDKKQAKYRQINKFIEQIEAISDALPDGPLCICDLCCGKSYLTFAVYRYFTFHKGRQVEMYGIDLKKDVIEYCREVAARLGWDKMTFECGDVSAFAPPKAPDLVISLHACDVATDYALAGAVKSGARVILSTPCCQHELNREMNCEELAFATDYSILKQKIASAMTDALRARLLEIYGYKVTVCELIDPEETPKNVIIRAIKTGKRRTAGATVDQYKAACELLGTTPTLAKLLPLPTDVKELPIVSSEK